MLLGSRLDLLTILRPPVDHPLDSAWPPLRWEGGRLLRGVLCLEAAVDGRLQPVVGPHGRGTRATGHSEPLDRRVVSTHVDHLHLIDQVLEEFNTNNKDTVTLSSLGEAITKSVTIAEIVKHRVKGLH